MINDCIVLYCINDLLSALVQRMWSHFSLFTWLWFFTIFLESYPEFVNLNYLKITTILCEEKLNNFF